MSTSSEVFQNVKVVHDISTARKINNLLNSPGSRIEGLELLKSFLPQCSDDDFLHFCINWMQNCCKIDTLKKKQDFEINLLCNLLKMSSSYQELKKSVSFFITTRYFDFFFKYFLNSQAGWSCTECCLLLYRGACGPFQENLEKHLKNEINKNKKISSILCRCFALMPSIGAGGNEGINHKKNWKNYFIEFLNICNSVLNDLFADLEKLQEFEIIEYSYKKNERNIEYLVTQLHNHCSVLTCMLLNQYPASKSVPSDLILQLICRGLSLNSKNMARRETSDVICLQKFLPDIHYTLLSLLKALIVTCKSQLFPYSHLICKLIKQSLEWTKSHIVYGIENSFGRLRMSIYESLCNWLAVAGSGSCIEVISSIIVSNAVHDIRCKKNVVFLREATLRNQSKNREEITRWVDVTANSRLCVAALKVLQCLLKFVGVLLKPEEHKFLQEVTVKLLVEVQKSSARNVVVPFSIPVCRMELYALLLELVHHPCPKWPPPTNLALRLFGRGINDTSPEVSLICSAALNFTTIIIHPQYDNGGFPLSKLSGNENQNEVELQERESLEPEKEKEISLDEISKNSENFPGLGKDDTEKKLSDFDGESDISSDEDSRNTVTYLESGESSKNTLGVNGNKTEGSVRRLSLSYEPSRKIRRTSKEEPVLESVKGKSKAESLSIKETLESDEMKKLTQTSLMDLNSSKSISPESINEDSQPKPRYFLRSKRKGSSEEPEEVSKRTTNPESLKSTLSKSIVKIMPVVQRTKKRPRTWAGPSINQTENKVPEKHNQDEDEDIKAAFDDSFLD